MASNLEKLRGLLQELFQMDRADLDFGIYRIMNQKRDDVVRFLDKDLLPQVKAAFSQYKSADKSVLQDELVKLEKSIQDAGMNPIDSPKVKELRQRIDNSAVDVTALEHEVFSHLFNFFRRYYSEGDFISLRRYKEGVYAIPYEGEEVKLHWANADQFYVKSTESFRDYTFKIAGGKTVRVHLVAANTEQDNNKAAPGKDRRFVICADNPLSEKNGELFIRFEYRPFEGNEKQDALNKQAIDAILKIPGFEQWTCELSTLAPTEKNPNRTVLEKHLTQYTERNTFDYFIHKDLGGFLRRELDFYIKNEVMHLDDIEHESVPKVEQYLSQIKVLRSIAHKIIHFIEQLENFQKRLWLKKKFVIETNYCITLDQVPQELYSDIVKNHAQTEEWIRLFSIDEIKKDLNGPGYSKPLKVDFLKANQNLVLDTRFFTADFVTRLLRGLDSLDEHVNGLLVHSENMAGQSLLMPRYKGNVDVVYADPPYNTDGSPILYKNGFKNSTWASLMYDRLDLSRELLTTHGILCATIDDAQQRELHYIIGNLFGEENIAGTVVIRANPSGRPIPSGFGIAHEYAIFARKSTVGTITKMLRTDAQLQRYNESDKRGRYMWELFRKRGSGSLRADRETMYYPLYSRNGAIRVPKMNWDDEKRVWIPEDKPKAGETVHYPIDSDGVERRWRWKHDSVSEDLTQFKVATNREDETIVYYKYRPDEDGVIPLTVWSDAKYSATEHGTGSLKKLFSEYKVFDFSKSVFAVEDCLHISGLSGEAVCLDCFAGSGTTGHAVINLNRRDGGSRRFILLEMGRHFDSVLKPRIAKVLYSSSWDEGKPTERKGGGSYFIKYIRLESYEDALNNLEMKRSETQQSLLDANDQLREQFILSYMLDVESRGSQSLLNVDKFRNPDHYKLRVERDGETKWVSVDLVETFNWLLGLTVKHIDVIRGVRVVDGKNPNGDRVLILWRNIDEMDNDALDKWFEKQGYSTRDLEYDLVYVNGDNNLENLCRTDQTWKVRLIEEEFQRLMFDMQDV